MTVKHRLHVLESSLPADPAALCCLTLTFETVQPYHAAVWERYARGPMPEAPPEFLPVCSRSTEPCSEARRHACAVWRNISRLEHLRNLNEEMFQ